MSPEPTRPFDSIESAHEFVDLLEESIEDAVLEVKDHIQTAQSERDERRSEALTLAMYKMSQLSTHMRKSRRILNDLRTIRRLLFQERDI
jgi:predicted RNase H-like nuclease